ncbi:MAG TPA: response regulator [Terriglobia bacterium]|nr:response regulator [Terriglobia bacterium]
MIKRILIIDDEDDLREVTQMSLEEMAGWQTLAAPSGAEGLKRAAEELPDVILLDVMMPDMGGMEVLARLKRDERTAAIPVVLLTAKVRAADPGRAAGSAGVIVKPFDPLQLAAQIAEILGWPPSTHEAPSGDGGPGSTEPVNPP